MLRRPPTECEGPRLTPTTVFWPMLAHVLLVYIVYAVLGIRRRDAVPPAGVL